MRCTCTFVVGWGWLGGGKQGNKQTTKWNLSHLFLSPFPCAKYVHVSVREFDKDMIRVLVRCREALFFSPFFFTPSVTPYF